jgi:hypothetical protein
VPDQRPLDQHPERAGGQEGEHHRHEEVCAEQPGQPGLEVGGGQVGDVGAEDHELAMRHVDDAHLAEDDRQPERHEHEDGEQDQAREALHHKDGAEVGERVVA